MHRVTLSSVTWEHKEGGWRGGAGWSRVERARWAAASCSLAVYLSENLPRGSDLDQQLFKMKQRSSISSMQSLSALNSVCMQVLLTRPPPDRTNAKPVHHFRGSSFTLRWIFIFSVQSCDWISKSINLIIITTQTKLPFRWTTCTKSEWW